MKEFLLILVLRYHFPEILISFLITIFNFDLLLLLLFAFRNTLIKDLKMPNFCSLNIIQPSQFSLIFTIIFQPICKISNGLLWFTSVQLCESFCYNFADFILLEVCQRLTIHFLWNLNIIINNIKKSLRKLFFLAKWPTQRIWIWMIFTNR